MEQPIAERAPYILQIVDMLFRKNKNLYRGGRGGFAEETV